MPLSKIFAWLVHSFTSVGLVFGFLAIVAIDKSDWRTAFIWLFAAFIVDGLDGTLARKFEVTKWLPHIDGKNIDYVIDFATYAIIPCYFFYKAEMVHEPYLIPVISLMLIVSCLYYGRIQMVEDEQYFVGFPVLWNFAVFFQFFVFDNHQLLNLVSTIILAVLHFAPIRFAYPSRSRQYFKLHLIVSVVGLLAGLFLLWNYPTALVLPKYLTIFGGLYFLLFVIHDTWFVNLEKTTT